MHYIALFRKPYLALDAFPIRRCEDQNRIATARARLHGQGTRNLKKPESCTRPTHPRLQPCICELDRSLNRHPFGPIWWAGQPKRLQHFMGFPEIPIPQKSLPCGPRHRSSEAGQRIVHPDILEAVEQVFGMTRRLSRH